MKTLCNEVWERKGKKLFLCYSLFCTIYVYMVYHFTGYLENSLLEFRINCSIVFVKRPLFVGKRSTSFCLPRVSWYLRGFRGKKINTRSNGLFMLCAWQHAIFTALPDKHNGQWKRNTVFCMQNICTVAPQRHIKKNQVYAAVCVSVSSNFGCQNYLSAVYFCYIFGSFETLLAIYRVWRQIFKKARVRH